MNPNIQENLLGAFCGHIMVMVIESRCVDMYLKLLFVKFYSGTHSLNKVWYRVARADKNKIRVDKKDSTSVTRILIH